MIEFGGWVCPLTPLENSLRVKGGEAGYTGDFIDHYILPALYPHGLTRQIQIILGALALAVNAVAYLLYFNKREYVVQLEKSRDMTRGRR